MADTTGKEILSVIATTGSRLSDLPIKNGQLIFIHDRQRIALDHDDKRKFYNCIVTLQSESERQGLLAPVDGLFYFVVGTAVLWTYSNGWIQITSPPKDVIFIGTQLPELGQENVLYVDKNNKEISIWDSGNQSFSVVAEKTEKITEAEINALFQ